MRFVRYALRTTDAPAARAFYDAVLGARHHEIVPLHEEAIARGAPSHWLGCLGVDDVERVATAFAARGATRLGPTQTTPRGTLGVVRDPGGAVVGLFHGPAVAPEDITWRLLHTNDLSRAQAGYEALFGWTRGATHDLGEHGVLNDFSFTAGEPAAGAMLSIAGRPGRHAHWLFHFRVDVFDAAVAEVRARGGLVVGVFHPPDGRRVAVCDDPQKAAFALREA
jgi:predicted enzyme related to lactoylglutathione lyase